MLNSINHDQRRYVLTEGTGYTCLGFDIAERKRQTVLAWIGEEHADTIPLGTPEHYDAYMHAMERGYAHHRTTGERCPAELEPQLMGLEGYRIEVTSADGQRERFIVGMSTGWMPCHLAMKRRDSSGGCVAYIPKDATVRRLAKIR